MTTLDKLALAAYDAQSGDQVATAGQSPERKMVEAIQALYRDGSARRKRG